MLGSFDQIQQLTSRLQQEQSENAYLKSESESMQKDLFDLRNRLSMLEDQLAEKDKLVKKLEDEVRCRRVLLAEQELHHMNRHAFHYTQSFVAFLELVSNC